MSSRRSEKYTLNFYLHKYVYTSHFADSFTCKTAAMTKLIYHYRYNADRLQILTCATRQTSKQITSRNDRSSSIDLAMHDIIQKSKRLFNKLENEKNKYEDLTYCDDENKIIAINKILNNKLNNLSVALCIFV